ncbi:MAG: DEAD/DEAH box helicase, partial [Nitrospinota bacterium]
MIQAFINEIKKSREFTDQVVHHEEIPASPPRFTSLCPPLPAPLQKALEESGIEKIYTHQAEAITHVRDGKNTLITTPTSSGKTLAYLLPVLEGLIKRPESHA